MRRKKGSFFFILDVFIGSFILLVTLLLVLSFKVSLPESEALQAKLDGFTTIVFKNSVSSFDNTVIQKLKANSETWPDRSMTTDEYIYYLYSNPDDYKANATELLGSLSDMLLPSHVGFNYSIDGQEIYSQNGNKKEKAMTVISDRKITFKLFGSKERFDPPVLTEVEIWQ